MIRCTFVLEAEGWIGPGGRHGSAGANRLIQSTGFGGIDLSAAPTTAQQILCPPTLIHPTPPTLAPFQTSPAAQLRQNQPDPNAFGASTSTGSAYSRPSAALCSA